MKSCLDRKTINDWLSDTSIKTGNLSPYNTTYLKEIKSFIYDFSIFSVVLYFGMYSLKMKQFNQLYNSVMRTEKFLYVVRKALKEKRVTQNYVSIFDKDIKALKKRTDHIWRIIKENYRYTEYYPFFESVGWDILTDFERNLDKEEFEAQFNSIIDGFNRYKAENQSIIDAHMKSVETEIFNYNEHKRKIAEKEKAEKEIAKNIKKKERDMEKEIAANNRKRRIEQRRIERTFEKYYR